ncbi:MAG: transcriptional regulator [Labilithrix sp.]|nr:transcriptional regulator [Labilithrix sp.]MBX3221573.1 transcriptional regulator [Labilithrix sp.]MBX3261671.1 transcriptional regulator [Labilithrix sp.]MCW5835982.1 transcriptional regulator [Labilithrix sp.]
MSGVPKSYRTMEEFEREAIRPDLKYGFSLDDLMQDTTFEGSDLLFDDTVDEYDPDQEDDDDDY